MSRLFDLCIRLFAVVAGNAMHPAHTCTERCGPDCQWGGL